MQPTTNVGNKEEAPNASAAVSKGHGKSTRRAMASAGGGASRDVAVAAPDNDGPERSPRSKTTRAEGTAAVASGERATVWRQWEPRTANVVGATGTGPVEPIRFRATATLLDYAKKSKAAFVQGSPGCGKSSLAHDLAVRAQEFGYAEVFVLKPSAPRRLREAQIEEVKERLVKDD